MKTEVTNTVATKLVPPATQSNLGKMSLVAVCWLTVLLATNPLLAQSDAEKQPDSSKRRVYLIGNSLTWDCVPAALGVEAQWHVDCGKNLKQIFNAPQKPCVPSSVIWTKALKENRYDVLCIQPHYGTNLAEDIDFVSQWVAMQPNATLVLHSGWPKHAELQNEYQRSDSLRESASKSMTMHHSLTYMRELAEGVSARHAGLKIRQTRVMEALHEIRLDIQAGKAPIQKISELYRDDIHLTFAGGRYLAHNMLRQSLNLPLSSQGFQLDDELKNYLDQTITRFGEAR